MTPPAAAAPAVEPRRGVPTRRPTAPPRPRRVSGPARPRTAQPRPRRGAQDRALIHAVPAAVGRLAEHRLIYRLIAGKAWIGVVAFALIGIVTLQLLMLQLNRSIGRDLARQGVLQRQNAALAIENSGLSLGERVQRQATGLGMTLVPAGALRFVSVQKGATAKAATALATPIQEVSPEGGEAASSSGEPAERSAASSSAEGSTASAETSAPSEGAGSAETPGGEAAHSSESGRSSETEAAAGAEGGESQASPPGEASGGEASAGGGTGSAPAG